MTSLDDVIAFADWRDRHELKERRDTRLREWAATSGVPVRQMSDYLTAQARARGWTDEQIAQAGISYQNLRRILGG